MEMRMRRSIDKSRTVNWIEGVYMATPLLPPRVALGCHLERPPSPPRVKSTTAARNPVPGKRPADVAAVLARE